MLTLLIAINAKYSHTSLAVRSLRAALAGAGLSASIAEYTINQPLREILSSLAARAGGEISPRFLFSCYLWNIDYVRRLGEDLRRLYPESIILLGGPEVSFESEQLLQELSFADGILSGEGETLLPEVLLRGQARGVFHARQPVDLDRLPFAYDDLAALSGRVIYYEASRGCPFSCAYCLSGGERRVRTRSLDLVFSDLQKLLDARVMQVKFVDRTFNANAARAGAIWGYLIERDNGVTSFQMEIGGDLLTDEHLDLLAGARPGLFQLEVGVQSTCETALEACCRVCDFEHLAGAMRRVMRDGRVHLHLDLIAGLPGESFSRFLRSYDEVFALAPHQLQLGFLKLLRGAPLYARTEADHLKFSPYPPYEILSTPELPFADLCRLKRLEEMTEVYYNSGRFSCLLQYLLAEETSPARFFLALADTLPETRPGKYDYYDLLYQFGLRHGHDGAQMAWRMRYDLCRHERPRRLPVYCAKPFRQEKLAQSEIYCEWFPFDPRTGAPGEVRLGFDTAKRDLFGRAIVSRADYSNCTNKLDK